jgi:hypothetical protein
MSTLSRALGRWDPIRVAAVLLGLALLLPLAAYGFALTTSNPTPGAIAAVVAAVGITGSGLLYAWRLGAGGIVD